jgi:hypothetical protein
MTSLLKKILLINLPSNGNIVNKDKTMDFNAIVNKLREIEPTDIANPNAEAPKADTKAPLVLSEAAQLRVKAGISTVLEESKKVEEAVDMCPEACCGKPVTECKCGPDCEHCDCHAKNAAMKEGKMPQAALDALKKKKGKNSKKADDDQKEESTKESKETKAKKFDEEVEDILKTAEAKLVKEAKKKMPDYPDVDGDGNKKEPIEQAQKDKKAKGGDKKTPASKGLSAKQKKLPAGLQNAIAKKKGKTEKGKTESVVTTKKAVAESMSFLDAIKIVKESNGEMKVNAVDTAIWNWAKRVAASKVTEGGVKQEAYAAKVYESKGGVWDVTRTVISE